MSSDTTIVVGPI